VSVVAITTARARHDFQEAMTEFTAVVSWIKSMEPELEAAFRELTELQRELEAHDGVTMRPSFGPLIEAARSKHAKDPFWDRSG
jgi:hypothetical protein